MDIDTQNEQLPNLHIDLSSGQIDLTRSGNLGWNIFRGLDCVINKVFVKGSLSGISNFAVEKKEYDTTDLYALCQRMTNSQLGHIVLLLAQADEICHVRGCSVSHDHDLLAHHCVKRSLHKVS